MAAVVAIAMSVAIPMRAHQRSDDLQPALEQRADRLAMSLAARGLSAGVVMRLPKYLEPVLERARARTSGVPGERTAFGVLLRDLASEPLVPITSPTSAETVLRAYTSHRAHEPWDVVVDASGVVLTDRMAGGCRAVLGRRVRAAHTAGALPDLVIAIVSDATPARVPTGYVGTCLSASMARRDKPGSVPPDVTLQDALNRAVAHFAGSVWLLVETPQGQCSLGLIDERDSSLEHAMGVCQMAVTDDLFGR